MSAKGAAARRQTVEKLAGRWGGVLDTAPVLRVFLKRLRVQSSFLRSRRRYSTS
jgi:hypothetical protein